MTSCIWYISKYVALPSARKGSARAFLLMREMVAAGHKAVILTSDSNHLTTPPVFEGPVFREAVDGVEVSWLRTFKFSRASSWKRVLSWFSFEWALLRTPKRVLPKPDVVIVSSPSLLTVVNGIILKQRFGCRLIVEVRDIWPLTLVEEGGYSRFNPLVLAFRALELLAYRHADEIVGTLPNLGQHVAESIRRPPPVTCIPFGVHPELIEDAQSVTQAWVEQHVPSGKFIVCHAGTIGISNALDTLVECARAMQDQDPDVHFLVVGEGGLEAHYMEMCRDLPNVSFTGSVPKDLVGSVLELSDALYFSVHASKVWDYGLSLNKVVDYMLAARPIIASYTGYPTMVDEASAGISAPAGDARQLATAIARMKDMPAEDRKAMGERGRAWLLKNRSYTKIAGDYLDIALR